MNLEQGLCIALSVLLVWLVVRYSMTRVYRFYRTTCPACVNSKPEWDKFASSCMLSMIRPIAVDLDLPANQALGAEFEIRSVPTVILVRPSGANVKYDGERTSEAYSNWVNSAS